MTPGPPLTIESLTVNRDGRDVVRDVSLTVPSGEVTALLGPNGAGKSTLVLAVSGSLRPSGGRVRLGPRDLTGMRPERVRAAGVATAAEGHRTLRDLSVADNLRVAGSRMGRAYPAGRDRVMDLFPELRRLERRRAGHLSGGEQQMLALAQAVIDPPQILIIDELSLGLAPVVVGRLMPTLTEIAGTGVGILLIEQFTGLALTVATTAGVLVRGRIRVTEQACVLRDNPALIESAYHLGDAA